jgi:ubiquinone/menaquinone biosynthesis C-methylase UbiE
VPQKNPQIIEFGCGNGWLAEKLAAFGPVTGVDIADRAIIEARRRVPNAVFYAGDALSLALPKEAFDVAVTLEMLSHVTNQEAFIETLASVLKIGGYLILTTQNRTIYMRRKEINPPAEGQLRHWVTMHQLRHLLQPYFVTIRAATLRPAGNLGFLHIVNSKKLNRLMSKIIPSVSLDHLKEEVGLGQTLLVLARKRPITLRISQR